MALPTSRCFKIQGVYWYLCRLCVYHGRCKILADMAMKARHNNHQGARDRTMQRAKARHVAKIRAEQVAKEMRLLYGPSGPDAEELRTQRLHQIYRDFDALYEQYVGVREELKMTTANLDKRIRELGFFGSQDMDCNEDLVERDLPMLFDHVMHLKELSAKISIVAQEHPVDQLFKRPTQTPASGRSSGPRSRSASRSRRR